MNSFFLQSNINIFRPQLIANCKKWKHIREDYCTISKLNYKKDKGQTFLLGQTPTKGHKLRAFKFAILKMLLAIKRIH
jgi:hypothetical protein